MCGHSFLVPLLSGSPKNAISCVIIAVYIPSLLACQIDWKQTPKFFGKICPSFFLALPQSQKRHWPNFWLISELWNLWKLSANITFVCKFWINGSFGFPEVFQCVFFLSHRIESPNENSPRTILAKFSSPQPLFQYATADLFSTNIKLFSISPWFCIVIALFLYFHRVCYLGLLENVRMSRICCYFCRTCRRVVTGYLLLIFKKID